MWFIQLFGRIHSTKCLRKQTGNELMLCQLEAQVLEPTSVTLFLLEFLGDFCLKVGFCLSGTERKNRWTCALELSHSILVFPPFDFQNGGGLIRI